MFTRNRFMFDEAGAGGGAGDSGDAGTDGEGSGDEFEAWLAKQPADIQKKYEDHVGGLTSALKKERAAAKKVPTLEKELNDFKAKEEKTRKDQMTKEESLSTSLAESQAARDRLAAENDQLRISQAVEREAAKLRFTDPVDALQLLPKDALKIEDGKVVGAAEALKDLAKAKPYLLVQEQKEQKPKFGTNTGKADLSKAEKSTPNTPPRARL